MAVTHRIGVTYGSDAGTIVNTTDTYTSDGEVNYDGIIPASTTNQECDFAVLIAAVKSEVLFSTTALKVLVNTSSSSTAAAVISLAASKQLVWTTDHLEANPCGVANITKVFLTNSSSSPATVKFRFLQDITPGGGLP